MVCSPSACRSSTAGCLVLTLSQVDGVDAVQIQSAGHTYHSRSHQTMQAEEAILDQEALSAPGD